MTPGPDGLDDLNPHQLERFQRHLGLAGFGPEAQLALLRSRVLVVGAGGLGAPVLTYLAAAGVGTIDVVDDDVVDRSNLHRQVIHSEATVGQPKTSSAAAVMRGLHPEVVVNEHRVRLDATNVLDLVGPVDLVVDGSDNFQTRYLVSDACEITGTPLVYGSILRFDGQVSLFWAGHGPTYRDVFPEPPGPGEVPSCAEAGVLGVLCGIVGSLMAAEAIKQITGIGRTLLGRVLMVDALTMGFRELALVPDPDRAPVTSIVDLAPVSCAMPVRTSEDEVDAAALRAELAGERPPRLLDVREDWERRLGAIEPSEHAPLGAVQADPSPWVGADDLVVYCKAGVRSAAARDAIREQARRAGVATRVRSLAGGFDGWTA